LWPVLRWPLLLSLLFLPGCLVWRWLRLLDLLWLRGFGLGPTLAASTPEEALLLLVLRFG
jgi:hypothetical protein